MVSFPQSTKLIGIAGKVLPTWRMAGPGPEEAMAVSGLALKAPIGRWGLNHLNIFSMRKLAEAPT